MTTLTPSVPPPAHVTEDANHEVGAKRHRIDYPPTIPFEEIERELLADPATREAYDALEPAYQITSLRIAAGLTQAQLAELVGTKQPSIARLERGQTQPTIKFLRRLGAALGKRLEIRFVPME